MNITEYGKATKVWVYGSLNGPVWNVIHIYPGHLSLDSILERHPEVEAVSYVIHDGVPVAMYRNQDGWTPHDKARS